MVMKYLGAYLMAVLGGKEAPDAKDSLGFRSHVVKRFGFLSPAQDIKTILEAGGISRLQQEHAVGRPVQW